MAAISTIIQSSSVISSPSVVSSPSATVIVPKSVPSSAQGVASIVVQRNTAQSQQPLLRDVQQAVKQANMSLPSSNESITFGYEEQLGQLIVQVSDKATGRVIQQLPSKEFIQYQIYMNKLVGLLLDKQA